MIALAISAAQLHIQNELEQCRSKAIGTNATLMAGGPVMGLDAMCGVIVDGLQASVVAVYLPSSADGMRLEVAKDHCIGRLKNNDREIAHGQGMVGFCGLEKQPVMATITNAAGQVADSSGKFDPSVDLPNFAIGPELDRAVCVRTLSFCNDSLPVTRKPSLSDVLDDGADTSPSEQPNRMWCGAVAEESSTLSPHNAALTTVLCVPVLDEGKLLAVVQVINKRSGTAPIIPFDQEDVGLLFAFGGAMKRMFRCTPGK